MILKMWDYNNAGDQLNKELFRFLFKSEPVVIQSTEILNKENVMMAGSILQYADANSIICGSGFMNEKEEIKFKPKKIVCVRGKLTRDKLLKAGIECPEVYGDPALLMPLVYQPIVKKRYKLGVVLHIWDEDCGITGNEDVLVIKSSQPVYEFINQINSCEKIVSSSLHGIILADTYGVPALWLKRFNDNRDDEFKFLDYFSSVNREETAHKYSYPEILNEFKPYTISIDLELLKNSILSVFERILCFIPTKDRYFTTLPLVIQSVIDQTKKPDKLIIYDDSINRKDLRQFSVYNHLFKRLDKVGIEWEVVFGRRLGQHFGHQLANKMDYKYVWRLDDDNYAEPDVLSILYKNMKDKVGAVAGLVLSSDYQKLKDFKDTYSDNIQWYEWQGKKKVKHLYSTFLYKSNLVDYELSLSKVAHREETIFTQRLSKGYDLIVDSKAVTWHYRDTEGGIRTGNIQDWQRDEVIFNELLEREKGDLIVYLDNGMGDHVCFNSILPILKKRYKQIKIFSCYPDLIDHPSNSIIEGKKVTIPELHAVYKYMMDMNWKGRELAEAFLEMYT